MFSEVCPSPYTPILPALSKWTRNLAGASVHRMYDHLLWMFIPENAVIERIHGGLVQYGTEWHAVRGAFPEFQVWFSLYQCEMSLRIVAKSSGGNVPLSPISNLGVYEACHHCPPKP